MHTLVASYAATQTEVFSIVSLAKYAGKEGEKRRKKREEKKRKKKKKERVGLRDGQRTTQLKCGNVSKQGVVMLVCKEQTKGGKLAAIEEGGNWRHWRQAGCIEDGGKQVRKYGILKMNERHSIAAWRRH